jgi:hypothetical protein
LQKPAIHAAFHAVEKKFPVFFPVNGNFGARSHKSWDKLPRVQRPIAIQDRNQVPEDE